MNEFYETHKERLRTLEAHLRSLPPTQFYFGTYVLELHECNTVACAIGWCPTVFPDQWQMLKDGDCGYPALRGHKHITARRSAQEFFGLTFEEASGLFFPDNYREWAEDKLDNYASAEQVADGIRDFILWKEQYD